MTPVASDLPFPSPTPDRPFVPWHLPHLAHIPQWREFSTQERITANRLMGLLVNEAFGLIEHRLIIHVLAGHARRTGDPDRAIARIIAEERRHARWFTAFAAAADPGAPPMMQVPSWTFPLLRQVVRSRAGAGAALWLTLATEEWAMRFAQALIADPAAADLDPAYLSLHRAHLADESRHVAHDRALVVGRSGSAVLGPLVRAVLLPRRGAARALERFAILHPRWRPQLPDLLAAVRAIGRDPGYWRRVFDHGLPVTAGALRRRPGHRPIPLLPGLVLG